MKRIFLFIVLLSSVVPNLLGCVGAIDVQASNYFRALTADEIHKIFPWKYSFQLSRGLERSAPFVFYGDKPNDFVTVECKSSALFFILSTSGEKGKMNVGVCREQKKQIVKWIDKALLRIREIVDSMRDVSSVADGDEFQKKLGWQYERIALGDGSELHYFPVLAVGHGIITVPTAVMFIETDAIIVQADITFCNNDVNNLRICTDTKNGFIELAKHIRTKLYVHGGSNNI